MTTYHNSLERMLSAFDVPLSTNDRRIEQLHSSSEGWYPIGQVVAAPI